MRSSGNVSAAVRAQGEKLRNHPGWQWLQQNKRGYGLSTLGIDTPDPKVLEPDTACGLRNLDLAGADVPPELPEVKRQGIGPNTADGAGGGLRCFNPASPRPNSPGWGPHSLVIALDYRCSKADSVDPRLGQLVEPILQRLSQVGLFGFKLMCNTKTAEQPDDRYGPNH